MKIALIALGLASFAFGGIITTDNSNSNLKTLTAAQQGAQGSQQGVKQGPLIPAQSGALVRPAFNQNGTSIYGNIRRGENGHEGQPRGEGKQLTEAEKAEFEAKRAQNGFPQRGQRKQLTEAEKAEFEAKRAQNGGNGFGPRGERKQLTEAEKTELEAKRAAWSKTEEGQAFQKKFEEWRVNQGQNGGNFTHGSRLQGQTGQSTGKPVDSSSTKK